MTRSFNLPRPLRNPLVTLGLAACLLLGAVLMGRVLVAQVEGDRGIAPIAASRDIDVSGIEVDVSGKSAQEAREKGWIEAQRKAWAKLGGPGMPDSQIQSMVSAVIIEKEQVGPRRYIARLGVIFDRGRAGAVLGSRGARSRSAPMLLLPVTLNGGSSLIYETRNPWQRVWAEYQPGASPIDYVRPSGAGGDSLMLTYGQTMRRSRTWWRNVLDQYGAADVLVAVARLEHAYPGGPITGTFTARYGPDNQYLGSFIMTAKNDTDLDRMLHDALLEFDDLFTDALSRGLLKPDPTLMLGGGSADPALQRLIDLGRRIEARERAAAKAEDEPSETTIAQVIEPTAQPTATAAPVANYVVQFATPDGGAFDSTLSVVRSTPGVRGAAITSTAIGGTSVMSVSFAGPLDQLAAALRSRGFSVNQGSNALAISR